MRFAAKCAAKQIALPHGRFEQSTNYSGLLLPDWPRVREQRRGERRMALSRIFRQEKRRLFFVFFDGQKQSRGYSPASRDESVFQTAAFAPFRLPKNLGELVKVETLSDFQLYPMRVRVERDESGGKSHFPEQKLEKAAYDREHTSSFASLLKHFLTSGTAAFALFSPTRRA